MQGNELSATNGFSDQTVSIKILPWQVKLFLLSLLIPTELSFNMGEFRLTVYRVILLLFFIPCLFRVLGGKNGRTLPTDWLLLGYSIWIILALAIHLGFSGGLKSGGILVVESFGAYLLARSFIRNEQEFGAFVKLLIFIVIGLSLFTIPEALTGKNFLRPHSGHIGGRLGLTRAFGPFDHPILYGMFCASAVSLALYVPLRNLQEKGPYALRAGWVVVAAFMSVSSGALASALVQMILAGWNRLTRGMASKWRLFSFLLVLVYIVIDLLSNRTPMKVILHRLTFSAETAYNRLFIWEWGTKHNVAEHPWFGIGFAEWVRPPWMHSLSMDNFWLVNMVRYGLPSFVLLAAGGLLLMFAVKRQTELSEPARLMRTGWGFAMIGLIIAGCTVHFWNSLHVWFFFMLGSGAWMASQFGGRTN
jgi:hypothetical protein